MAFPGRPLRLRARLPLLVGYLFSSGTLLAGSVSQLATFAILARGLGVEQFGLLVTVTAVANVAVQLCGLGATETLVRRVAPDAALYPRALGHALILTGASGLALTAVLALALPAFVTLSPDPVVNALALAALAATNVVLVRLVLLAEQIFIARWQIGRANLAHLGFALGRTAAAALACGAFGVEEAAPWAFWSLAAHLAMAALAWVAVRGFGPPRWELMREELPLGLWFTTPFVARALRQNADLLVLGAVAGPETVGAFSMARRIVDTSILSVEALHRLTYPRLARAAGAGYRAMGGLIGGVFLAALALALATALGSWLIAPGMPWLFGRDFGEMVPDLRAMCGVLVLVAIHDVAAEVLGASARHRIRAMLYNIGNLAGAGLSVALTFALALPGTILALYLTEAGLVVAFWSALAVLVRREVRADPVAVPVGGRA